MTVRSARGPFLTLMAVLFAVLALSDATKVLQHQRDPAKLGIVLLGVRFESVASNAILGPITGAVLALYAYGLWRMRRWVLPLSIGYAFWVPTNLVLFWYRQIDPAIPPLGFIMLYLLFAIGGSVGTAIYLAYHHERLG